MFPEPPKLVREASFAGTPTALALGTRVTFHCPPGHIIDGGTYRERGNHTMTCQEDGQFRGEHDIGKWPICEADNCK